MRSSTALPAALHLAKPIVGIAVTPDGKGYWLVASDGGIFNYRRSTTALLWRCTSPRRSSASPVTPDGKGYWLVASDGGIFDYRDTKYHGSPVALHLAKAIVGIATAPDGKGYWLASSTGAIYPYGSARNFGPGAGLSPRRR